MPSLSRNDHIQDDRPKYPWVVRIQGIEQNRRRPDRCIADRALRRSQCMTRRRDGRNVERIDQALPQSLREILSLPTLLLTTGTSRLILLTRRLFGLGSSS